MGTSNNATFIVEYVGPQPVLVIEQHDIQCTEAF